MSSAPPLFLNTIHLHYLAEELAYLYIHGQLEELNHRMMNTPKPIIPFLSTRLTTIVIVNTEEDRVASVAKHLIELLESWATRVDCNYDPSFRQYAANVLEKYSSSTP